MTTGREIARLARVSPATVSRVVQGATNVNEETRARVERVMAEVGYIPNALASAMRTRRTGAVGVVAGQLTNPWYPLMLEMLAKRLAYAGLSMHVWISDGEITDRSAINAIRSGTIDGLLFTTATRDSRALPAALESGLPLVLVNRTLEDVDGDQIVSDNLGGGRAAASYLLRHGRTDVAVIGGWPTVSTGRDRRRGFIEEFENAGITIPPSRTPETEFTYAAGLAAGRALVSDGETPSAVFCATDVIAFGVMDAAREAGLQVPEDMWVIGYDDIPMASWGAMSLTTVHQPMEQMADSALKMLTQRIANPNASFTHTQLESELIVRNSTAFAPTR